MLGILCFANVESLNEGFFVWLTAAGGEADASLVFPGWRRCPMARACPVARRGRTVAAATVAVSTAASGASLPGVVLARVVVVLSFVASWVGACGTWGWATTFLAVAGCAGAPDASADEYVA